MSNNLKVLSIGMSKSGDVMIGTDKGRIKVKVKSLINVISNYDRQQIESKSKDWDETDKWLEEQK